MRRTLFFLFCTIVSLHALLGQEYNNYEQVLAKKFIMGKSHDEFGVINVACKSCPSNAFRGPSAFCFDSQRNLYIMDDINERLVVLNESFNFIREIKPFRYGEFPKLQVDSNNNIFLMFDSILIKLDKNANRLFLINMFNTSFRDRLRGDNFVIIDNLIIKYLSDGRVISFKNPGSEIEKNNENILDQSKTTKEIEKYSSTRSVKAEKIKMIKYEPSEHIRNILSQKSIDVSSSYMIFKGDELLTSDFRTFYFNISEKTSSKSIQISKNQNILNDIIKRKLINLYYIGKDNSGNIYWEMDDKLLVFNTDGVLIDAFNYKRYKEGFGSCFPVISPEGDIYNLYYNDTGIYLYKVKRVW